MDQAIRSNLDRTGKYSEVLKDLKLLDYKVRILNTGTNAVTRVSIEVPTNQIRVGLPLAYPQTLSRLHLKLLSIVLIIKYIKKKFIKIINELKKYFYYFSKAPKSVKILEQQLE